MYIYRNIEFVAQSRAILTPNIRHHNQGQPKKYLRHAVTRGYTRDQAYGPYQPGDTIAHQSRPERHETDAFDGFRPAIGRYTPYETAYL